MIETLASRTAEPLLLSPHYAGFAGDLARVDKAEPFDHALDVAAVFGVSFANQVEKPFAFADGIAYIPVRGSLINRSTASYSFVTGYKSIEQRVSAAVADPDVRGIVLDVDSFGGEAAGCFECAAVVQAARAIKPVLAVVDSNAYSAGYAVAAAATRVSLVPSGGAGSVGVVTMHVDYSKAMDDAGYKVTFVFAGDHKIDGNPYEPLPASVKANIQARIDDRYAAFVAHVAQARGMTEQAVRDTQAATFGAKDALALGLIDSIAPAPEALAAFLDSLPAQAGSAFFMEQKTMSDPVNTAAPDAAIAEAKTAERARCKAILMSAEADGRGDLASHLAFESDLTADQATAMLGKAPKAQAAAPAPQANAFAAAMDRAGTPGVATEASAPGEVDAAKAVLAAFSMATGHKF